MKISVLFGLFLASAVSAQVVVKVGSTASATGGVFQFIPNSVTAANGTVVSFEFTGIPGNHSVTQSSFADPCDPVSGGFDSGWIFLPANLTAPTTPPTFNITITNDAKPIWFFCKQLLPSPHCSAGMVGAINTPTTNNTIDAFIAKAKAVTVPSGQSEGGLVGVGASASAGIGPVPSGATLFGNPAAASATATIPATGSAGASGASPSPSSNATTSSAIITEGNVLSVFGSVVVGLLLV